MKKITISALAFSGIVLLNSCGTAKTADASATENQTVATETKTEVPEEGLNLDYMDKSVRPQMIFSAM